MKLRRFFTIPPLFRENLHVALTSIKNNKLRSSLTILIIAIGIMSLVGTLTAVEALSSTLRDSFKSLGTASFTIQSRYGNVSGGGSHTRLRNTPTISYFQATEFAKSYKEPSLISIWTTLLNGATVKYEAEKTSPVITVMGVDPNYMTISDINILSGRGISEHDVSTNAFVAVVGNDVVALFKGENPIGEYISVNGNRYLIIGILQSKGSDFGGGENTRVYVPVTNGRAVFGSATQNYRIIVLPNDIVEQERAIGEAEVRFRAVRRLAPMDPTDFRIVRANARLETMEETMGYVTIAAFIIGFITLLGASVGLMNIMLVSVNERIREIGARKALGATSQIIKQQFLMEAIVIGQLGGLLGIVLGILIGNLTASLMEIPAVIPWLWMAVGIAICFGVSIASGYLPAVRASRLDPIESLRYE